MNFLNNKSIQLKRISKLLQLLLFFLAIAISTTSMAQTKKDSTKTEKKPVQKTIF